MKDKAYYKIVAKLPFAAGLWSSATRVIGSATSVAYEAGKRTLAPSCGPLLVFDTLESARRFYFALPVATAYHCQIWQCMAGKPRRVKHLLRISASTPTESIRRFWRGERINTPSQPAPYGTIAVDWVELVKECLLSDGLS